MNPTEIPAPKAVSWIETQSDYVYALSENALMAHSLRACVQLFQRFGLTLIIEVFEDRWGSLRPEKAYGEKKPKSVLMCHYESISISPNALRGAVRAKITVRKDLNRYAARLCIAHEIAHLLVKLRRFQDVPSSDSWTESLKRHHPKVENLCDRFASRLYIRHMELYGDADRRRLLTIDTDGGIPLPEFVETAKPVEKWGAPYGLLSSGESFNDHPFQTPDDLERMLAEFVAELKF